jgi:hypothetical protein
MRVIMEILRGTAPSRSRLGAPPRAEPRALASGLRNAFLGGLLIAAAALGQTFEARHDHWKGYCSGRLTLDEAGVAFESATKPDHSWRVPYLELQQAAALDNGEFRLLTYKDRKWRLGADREYRVEVTDKKFAAQVRPDLERRLGPRFVAGVAPGDVAQPLWELPVKHLLRLTGSEGVLVVTADRMVYRTETPGESRDWPFADIESVSTSGPYQLTITTLERARSHYGNRKGFNFQLKEPLSQERYNELWLRLEKSKGLQELGTRPLAAGDPFAAFHERLEAQAERVLAEPAVLRPEPAAVVRNAVPARDLASLVLWNVARVESGFQARALSPKGALGMWQFMPETGRRFGLRVDDGADERLDPGRSSVAAARYLGYLHGLFGDWKLALAGYNAGEQRVRRAIEQTGTRDFDELARRGALPRETRQYVPKVLAGVPVEAPVSRIPQVLIAPIGAN